jgi:hypothetical protein
LPCEGAIVDVEGTEIVAEEDGAAEVEEDAMGVEVDVSGATSRVYDPRSACHVKSASGWEELGRVEPKAQMNWTSDSPGD